MDNQRNAVLEDDAEAALAAMGADELREIVCGILVELDAQARSRVVGSLIIRAARSGSGWTPAAIDEQQIVHALAFAEAAARAGEADPAEVDEYLRRGSGAFLRKDYAAAHRIWGALLRPIGEGEIYLGQHELVSDVLGVDTDECAVQYVVSAYMTSAVVNRAEAVLGAMREVRGLLHFWEPIRQMERVAIEPLPELDRFLSCWRELVEKESAGPRHGDRDGDKDRWLREVSDGWRGPTDSPGSRD